MITQDIEIKKKTQFALYFDKFKDSFIKIPCYKVFQLFSYTMHDLDQVEVFTKFGAFYESLIP